LSKRSCYLFFNLKQKFELLMEKRVSLFVAKPFHLLWANMICRRIDRSLGLNWCKGIPVVWAWLITLQVYNQLHFVRFPPVSAFLKIGAKDEMSFIAVCDTSIFICLYISLPSYIFTHILGIMFSLIDISSVILSYQWKSTVQWRV